MLENSGNVPVHGGANVFKVFGRFTGGDNYSGTYQDMTAAAGQIFTADGWALTPSGDQIAGANTAWIEVSFRDTATNILSLYRSALVNSSTTAGTWLKLAITNQLNPATAVVTGSVASLVAPTNTNRVRYQMVFRQPATAAGAVLFDDLNLMAAGGTEFPVPVSAALGGGSLNLAFATYLNLPYQVRWKASLTDPEWLPLTNVAGNGSLTTLAMSLQSATRFYQVMRLCN